MSINNGHVSLAEIGYNNTRGNNNDESNFKDINEIVDVIVEDLRENNAQLITDINQKIVDPSILEEEIIIIIDKNKFFLDTDSERKVIIQKVKDNIFGWGIIQALIDDKDVSDIKIVRRDSVIKKTLGKRSKSDVEFSSDKSLLNFTKWLAYKNNGILNQQSLIQRLSDTTSHPDFIMRISIAVSPITSHSPAVVEIRKHPRIKFLMKDLVEKEMLTEEMADYLVKAAKSEFNIIWCGEGGSGKTSNMNALLEEIPADESTLVIQETLELHSNHQDIIFEQRVDKNGDDSMEVSLKILTQNALTQDLDRIIISEIKDSSAMDLLNASFTGHTYWYGIHSIDSMSALPKAIHYMKDSGTSYSDKDLLKMLSNADLIVFMKDFKCLELTEVVGFDDETKTIIYNPVYRFDVERDNGGTIEGNFVKLNGSCDRTKKKLRLKGYVTEEPNVSAKNNLRIVPKGIKF